MGAWSLRPRIFFGAPPSPPQPPIVLTPAADGPDPDNAARAMRAVHAAAKVADVRPEDSPQAGRYEQLRPAPPEPRMLGAEGHPCPRCAGLEQTISQMQIERAHLRAQLAAHELRAT